MAEISAAFPTVIIDNGTNRKTYRCTQDIRIGDLTVDPAVTTLRDTNVGIFFDSGKTLRSRSTQDSSWFLRLGTKIGTGVRASGKDGCDIVFGAAPVTPINRFIYGGSVRITSGALTQSSGNNATEIVNCLYQSASSGTTPMSFGTFGAQGPFDNIYNLDISHVTTAQVMSNFYALTAERITVACAAPTTFLATSGVNVSIKDLAMFGSPTQSDLRWTSAVSATGWVLVRPIWTGNAPKFTSGNATSHVAGTETYEYWLYDVKCVDGAGAGVSGIPVKVTDVLGNVQIDTTTNSSGQITYGSGLTTNALIMMDHYAVSGVYTQRHRGPFLTEVNMSYQAGYNNNYASHRYYWRPPGYESITTSAGSFEDVADILQMSAPSSGGSTWVETVVP